MGTYLGKGGSPNELKNKIFKKQPKTQWRTDVPVENRTCNPRLPIPKHFLQ